MKLDNNIDQLSIDRDKQLYAEHVKSNMNFFEWRDFGIAKGWISEPFCDTHDAGHLTDEEEQAWEDGQDPCMPVFRIWEENIEEDDDQEALF
jgi:hypothetical protein